MSHPHGVVEPVLTEHQSCIWFRCPCGWHSHALRPEAKGTLSIICTEYREHLTSVGYYSGGRTRRPDD